MILPIGNWSNRPRRRRYQRRRKGNTLLSMNTVSDTPMCNAPSYLPDGTRIHCRKCWQCRDVKVTNWAVRIQLEAEDNLQLYPLTLTYGRDQNGNKDHIRSKVLMYSDVQKFLKRLRKKFEKVRYVCAGEHGELKGRSHWHMALFLSDYDREIEKAIPIEKRVEFPTWGHGTVWRDQVTERSLKYIAKYCVKQENKVGHFAMSKTPPIGYEAFMRMAETIGQSGTLLTEWNIRTRYDKRTRITVPESIRTEFLRRYARAYRDRTGVQPDNPFVNQEENKAFLRTSEGRLFKERIEDGKRKREKEESATIAAKIDEHERAQFALRRAQYERKKREAQQAYADATQGK